MRRWRREGKVGGLDERQKWLEERWEERRLVRYAGVIGLGSRAVDNHCVVTGLIHRIVVGGAVLEEFVFDFTICSNLEIRIWQRRTHASQYLEGELDRPQLRLNAFEAKFGLRFVIRFLLLYVPQIGVRLFRLYSVPISQLERRSQLVMTCLLG
jgi:hypothetical protein